MTGHAKITALTATIGPQITPDLAPDLKVNVPAFRSEQGLIALL
jgi:hypothetical protein